MSKLTVIVGGTGKGKTSFTKNRLKSVNKNALFIYDVNKEYTDFTKDEDLSTITEFTNIATRLRDAVIVFEEATIFFKARASNDSLTEIMVRKRHTNNTIFLIFHSLRAVPRFIYDYCNYLVLFKTNDSPSLIAQKFKDENLDKAFGRIKVSDNEHYYEIMEIN